MLLVDCVTQPLPHTMERQNPAGTMQNMPVSSRFQLTLDSWTSPSSRSITFAPAPLHRIPPTRRLQASFVLVQRFFETHSVCSYMELKASRHILIDRIISSVQPNLAIDPSVDPNVYTHGLNNMFVDEMMRQLCIQTVCVS